MGFVVPWSPSARDQGTQQKRGTRPHCGDPTDPAIRLRDKWATRLRRFLHGMDGLSPIDCAIAFF
jgi:hypothetical protein